MDTAHESAKVIGPQKKDLTFHPFDITPESAHTALLLLVSKEPHILSKTLRAITKFGAQDLQNCQVLFELNGVDYCMPLIEHSEQNIKRFALTALSQLCQLPVAIDRVLANPQNLKKVTYMIAKVEDIFVLEFASLLLSKLTTKQLGCEQLIEANILGSLFSRMKNSLDPDVQKNCLQTLSNLLSIPACASEVTRNQQFSWSSLLVLTKSKFLAIQSAALRTVDQLISRYFDAVVQKSFKASTGVLDHCDILESYEFRDMHSKVLGNLCHYVETEDNAAHFYYTGCVERLLNYLDTTLPPMKPYCLAVLTKMSFTNNGRDALYETGTDLVFAAQLLSSNVELLADAAMGVANMTKLLPAAVRMSDTNIIEVLCGILNDDAAAWFYIRMNSLRALADLCRIIPKAAYSLVEPNTFAALRYINLNYEANPIEAQRLAVQCCINLQNYHVSTRAMHNMEFIQELVDIMTRRDITLKILTSKALTGLMSEEIAKDLFTACKGEQVISTNLRIEHIALRTALCGVIAASVTDEGADVYLELGTIHYMVENHSARYTVSAWEPALEAIFRHHPSAKLAYTGRLDVDDFTREGFYVQKRLGDSFPTIQEILSCPPPHRDPVFICRFYQPPAEVASGLDIRTPYSQTESRLATSSMSRFRLPLPDDANLRSYLLKMRVWFGEPSKSLHYFEIEDAHYEVRYREKCAEVPLSLKQRAQLLSEFVAEQMSGIDQERDCALPSVNLHLMDLMHDLESRVLGLGWVRCGGAVERAVLYKVLADRVGLPCALHRRAGARAWCEVAVPEPDQADQLDKEANFPAGLLRPNYVVDLMVRPGRLLPTGSHEARLICGPPGAPRYTSRRLPDGCRCEFSAVHSTNRSSHTSVQR